eukprot:5628993-Alexandrium_andersonii.AAC.1
MDGDGLEGAPDESASAGGVLEHPSAEGREPRVARDPATPAGEERKRRERARAPFRSRRQHCVRGRMSKLPRSSAPAGAHDAPE